MAQPALAQALDRRINLDDPRIPKKNPGKPGDFLSFYLYSESEQKTEKLFHPKNIHRYCYEILSIVIAIQLQNIQRSTHMMLEL